MNEPHVTLIDIKTALGVVSPIVLALAGAIVYLWRRINNKTDETETKLTIKLDECEKKHSDQTDRFIEMARELGEVKGRIDGIEQLSAKVLKQIHDGSTE